MFKTITLFILAAIAAYALLIFKPGLYFNKKAEYGAFTLRARGTLPEAPETVLDLAKERIAASDMFTGSTRFEIFLPATDGQYKFFTPFMEGEYYRVNQLTGAIFLAAADFPSKNAYISRGKDWPRRSLDGAITAAAAWEMTRLKIKPLKFVAMRKWLVRGYSELLSGGTSEFEVSDACAGGDRPGLADYRYGLMLDAVLKQEGLIYSDLVGKNFSLQAAEQRFRSFHCGGK